MFGAIALVGVLAPTPSPAKEAHSILTPSEIKWGPAPPVMRPGVQSVILYGDPSKKGLFVMRLKFPKGYELPPHFHPVDELVTIVSGLSKFGMGEKADLSKTTALPPGSFFHMPPKMPHFAFFQEETVIQINTVGPWGVTYVNPADDPRKSQ
jgi:quercetin dioxygenase-like cupin family protein